MATGSFGFQPIGKRVLIRLEELPKKSGRFHLAPSTGHNSERPQIGRLMAIGKGMDVKHMAKTGFSARIGNRVVVNPYNGKDVDLNGIRFRVFDDHAVLAVVEE